MSAAEVTVPRFRLGTLLMVVLACAWPFAAGAERVKGSGVSKTETRPVSGFRGIALGIAADVEVRQGSAEGVVLTGDDNVVPLVETVVERGVLQIRWKSRNLDVSYRRLALVVDARTIESVAIGGSGSVHADPLKAGDLKLTIGGSGDVAIDGLEATGVTATLAGSGNVRLAGRADVLEATIAGSGDLAAGKLQARSVRVAMQGSGTAAVRASDTLDATVAGSGEIVYHGKPAVKRTIMGSGSVRAAGGS